MTDEETPKMDLQQAVMNLSVHRQEWLCLLQFLDDEREQFLADMRQAENPNDVMKASGSIATLTELKASLSPDGWK